MLTNYTFEELTSIAIREKPFKRKKSWGAKEVEYPMTTRARSYFYFVPVADENAVIFKYEIKIHILNKSRFAYGGADDGGGYVEHKSDKGGVCFTIYDKQDNPKYKDYMGNILDKYASEKVWKIKEIHPLIAEIQYQIDGETIKPITKYDMIARKLNSKRALSTRNLKYNDKENFFVELFNLLLEEVMEHPVHWNTINLTDLEISREVDKAKKYGIVSSVFYANYLTRSIHNENSISNICRWGDFPIFMWEHYMLYMYEKEDCYDKKSYPCEDKYFPSNPNIKIQMRGEKL